MSCRKNCCASRFPSRDNSVSGNAKERTLFELSVCDLPRDSSHKGLEFLGRRHYFAFAAHLAFLMTPRMTPCAANFSGALPTAARIFFSNCQALLRKEEKTTGYKHRSLLGVRVHNPHSDIHNFHPLQGATNLSEVCPNGRRRKNQGNAIVKALHSSHSISLEYAHIAYLTPCKPLVLLKTGRTSRVRRCTSLSWIL